MRPRLPLAELSGGPDFVVLCPTARAAASLRRAHGALQAARGLTVAPPLHGATPAQWLDHVVSAALLRGELPADAAPAWVLSRVQERCLWEQAIADDSAAAGGLFDIAGMAQAAMEADRLVALWRLEVPQAFASEEYLAWRRWQSRVDAACRRLGARTAVRTLLWRIECIARGAGRLPSRVGVCGFAVPDATLERVLAVLAERGVDLVDVETAPAAPTDARVVACADAQEEIALAAAWAARKLAEQPQARLCIAMADVRGPRPAMALALDRALHPHAIGAGAAGMARCFAFADGMPLAASPPVETAFALIGLALRPQRVALAEFGRLLCAPGWSADVGEADARAQFDAWLRDHASAEASLEAVRRALARSPYAALLASLSDALAALAGFAANPRRLPSAWGQAFTELLARLGWPGERPPDAQERADLRALGEECAALATLDGVLGRVDGHAAARALQQACRERRIDEPRAQAPSVLVCSHDEVPLEPLDGLWVTGLEESVWPPPARVPPLLPAAIVRAAGVPESRGDLLAASASLRQARWCAGVRDVRLSWPCRDGERALAASPLLADLPSAPMPAPAAPAPPAVRETLDDADAPPMSPDEIAALRGGTALLAAQAACPAWAYYRYRLGARALAQATTGLDARMRGGLLHAALEAFWRGRSLSDLLAMTATARLSAVEAAIAAALATQRARVGEPPSARLLGLEARRLRRLLARWLDIEAGRADFTVIACEERRTVDIGGLPVEVVADRVDALADGALAVIDYKSGRTPAVAVWAGDRLLEPQLPIYAAIAYADRPVEAVAFAKVHVESPGFAGVSAREAQLPGVRTLGAQRNAFAESAFSDWAALRAVWAERLAAVAAEVRAGRAAVVVADEKALAWCEVLPLLRLGERRRQWDAARGAAR